MKIHPSLIYAILIKWSPATIQKTGHIRKAIRVGNLKLSDHEKIFNQSNV